VELGQADRGRPVRRREGQRRAQQGQANQAMTLRGSPRTAAGPRTTCSRPTSVWWSRWPSATPGAACSSST
jgi:hypothetical protein